MKKTIDKKRGNDVVLRTNFASSPPSLSLAKAYIRGQEEDHEYQSPDYDFCGKDLPERVKTPGPRLVLLFNAGSRPGSGFKATYHFETGEKKMLRRFRLCC